MSNNNGNPPSNDDVVIQLEDSSAGSTQPVDEESNSEGSADRRLSASSSRSGSMPGVSTGGFETMMGKLIVSRGLATAEEIELCNSLLKESSANSDEPRTLADVLTENEYITHRQLSRLREDFEARKSTKNIPGYKIKGKLGAGAMATVFLGRQLSLDRLVAIKVLPKKFSQNDKFIERFYKEGRAAAQLNHPNIVAAYDVGKAGEHHYFVMEYVDGPTVYDMLVKRKRIKEKEAIRVVTQVAYALQHAHSRGFIHRDIKPKNIMMNKAAVVKLADLGLARAMTDQEAAKAEAGRAYGTPYYISPEQIRGSITIGPPADIYGLGATFYHMVTGRVPFEGKNPSAVMHRHLKDELKPPDHLNPEISNGTALVIETMMAKNPKDRYQNAEDLIEDLQLIAKGQHPRIAKGGIDLSHITSVANAPTKPAASAARHAGQTAEPVTSNPLFMTLLVVMIVSIVINLILAVVVAGG